MTLPASLTATAYLLCAAVALWVFCRAARESRAAVREIARPTSADDLAHLRATALRRVQETQTRHDPNSARWN